MDETGRHDIVQLDESSDGLPIIQTTRRPDNQLAALLSKKKLGQFPISLSSLQIK